MELIIPVCVGNADAMNHSLGLNIWNTEVAVSQEYENVMLYNFSRKG